MKTNLLTFGITGCIAIASLSAIAQESRKADATTRLAAGTRDLEKAKVDSASDFQKFKIDAEMRISENQSKISMFRAKKWNESKDIREKYDQKVWGLEKKNDELRSKIRKSSDIETTRWTSFKREFNCDMNELALAIKDFGIDNKK